MLTSFSGMGAGPPTGEDELAHVPGYREPQLIDKEVSEERLERHLASGYGPPARYGARISSKPQEIEAAGVRARSAFESRRR
jgi:hypothetical protein